MQLIYALLPALVAGSAIVDKRADEMNVYHKFPPASHANQERADEMNVYHKFPPASQPNQKRADEMNVGLKNPQASAQDICGLDMVWDGTRCRVPVGKRQSDLADTPCPPPRVRSASGECVIMTSMNKREAENDEEKRQFGCPPGLIKWQGGCFTPGAVTPTVSEQEKRQFGCPPGLIKWQGGCFTPGVAATAVSEQAKRQLSDFSCPPGFQSVCGPFGSALSTEKRDEDAMDKRITCPEGTTMTKTGRCLGMPILPKKRQATTLPAVVPCPLGTVLKNGQCVNFSLGAIPRKRQDSAVANVLEHPCPYGQLWEDGACKPIPVVWWA